MDILAKSTDGPGQVYWHQEDLTKENMLLEDGANRDVFGFFEWVCKTMYPDEPFVEYLADDMDTGEVFTFQVSYSALTDLVSFRESVDNVWNLTRTNNWSQGLL